MPELRQYQIEDINFLSPLNSGACFNQQRTGKTPTALKIIEAKGLTKVVVIVPGSAIFQWQEEYERWINKPCIAIYGTPKQRQNQLKNWTHGLVISYDTIKKSQKSAGMIRDILNLNPEMIILDEAHRIKSRTTRTKTVARTDAIMCFRNIPQKLILTATPAPGKPEEIFNLLNFLFPNKFPSYWKFIDNYFKRITKYGKGGRTYIDIEGFQDQAAERLQQFMDTFSTQRKRKDVMPWLPEKDYTQIKLPLDHKQKKYLDELEKYWETEHITTKGTLDRLIRYRQICLDPELLNLKGKSPKTEWVLQYLSDYPEESIIIFSKFTSYLNKILPVIQQNTTAKVMCGNTSVTERNTLKQAFQEKKFRVLLLNIDVGKESLTLDTAETIIFTDKYPPIGDIEQAEDRFIASTIEKANKAHKIYELMMKNTYDEHIYTLLEKRKSETDLLNDYKKYLNERRKQHES